MSQEPIDVFERMRESLEAERVNNESFRVRHFGVADQQGADRVARRRKQREFDEAATYIQDAMEQKGKAERMRSVLTSLYGDLERMHSPSCARVGVGCPACESQSLIEDVL